MPYRRLPKTDSARLKALKTLLENNEIYTVRNRFIDWKLLNRAQPLHDRLLTATEQYKISMSSQVQNARKMDGLQHRASMYLSHFLQVLLMSADRGEIKRSQLPLYGLDERTTALPNLKTTDGLLKWGPIVIEGEKARQKKGGVPSIILLSAWFLLILISTVRHIAHRGNCNNEQTEQIRTFPSCAQRLMSCCWSCGMPLKLILQTCHLNNGLMNVESLVSFITIGGTKSESIRR